MQPMLPSPVPPQPPPPREILPQLDIYPPRTQRRWTVLLRLILVIPQYIAVYIFGIAAEVVAFIGWFGALGTGRLPRFAGDFLAGYVRYYVRTLAYIGLLVEEYPPFDLTPPPSYPVQVELPPSVRLNRAAVFFRFILIIPAGIVLAATAVGWEILAFFFWVAVLIDGRTPASVFDCTAAVLRYIMRAMAYFFMLTPAYPKGLFGDGSVAPPPPAPYSPQPQGSYGPPPGQVGYQPTYGTAPYPAQPQARQYSPSGRQPPYGPPPGWPPEHGHPGAPPPMAAPVPQGPNATRPLQLSGGGRGLLVVDIILGAIGYFGWLVAVVVLAATGHLSGGVSYGYGYGYGGTYHFYGSGGSDEQHVAQTIDDYYRAFGADNGAAACAHLTDSRRSDLVARSGAPDCPAAVHVAREGLNSALRSRLAHVDVLLSNIDVTGDRAIWTNPKGDGAVLERVGQTWKIARFQ
jgi:hypothetical protein